MGLGPKIVITFFLQMISLTNYISIFFMKRSISTKSFKNSTSILKLRLLDQSAKSIIKQGRGLYGLRILCAETHTENLINDRMATCSPNACKDECKASLLWVLGGPLTVRGLNRATRHPTP